jgi:hypothetical protein
LDEYQHHAWYCGAGYSRFDDKDWDEEVLVRHISLKYLQNQEIQYFFTNYVSAIKKAIIPFSIIAFLLAQIIT